MDNKKFEQLCKNTVYEYVAEHVPEDGEISITHDDIYVVWMCKTLQNNKALLSTTLHDGMYYECTYNGDKKELYFDAYKKLENRKFDVINGG
ncbi:hypothetical protein DXC78_06670 [Faecalicoccus pleomorphus]|uniref:Phage protein n=1 Tax=Faecalicoccus pleomorphus TaxID=1323 RepID=A0A3E3E618_9FIRM|nr:DUF6275 family protein [Faecalicoccus pleomorphus]RGD76367.1 hypothetical protein DXC78_06670 [Faecalicoccus pleomorphus]